MAGLTSYQVRVPFYTYWVGRRQQAIKDGQEEPSIVDIHEDFCKTMEIAESDFSYDSAKRAIRKLSELYENGA